MSHELNRKTNMTSASATASATVDEAARYAERLIEIELPATGFCRSEAIARVSARYGVSPTDLRNLTQPSRRPKAVAEHLKLRLREALLIGLGAWARALEHEYAVEKSKGPLAPDLAAAERDVAVAMRALERAKARLKGGHA